MLSFNRIAVCFSSPLPAGNFFLPLIITEIYSFCYFLSTDILSYNLAGIVTSFPGVPYQIQLHIALNMGDKTHVLQ